MDVVEEKPVTISEVKEILKAQEKLYSKEDREMPFEVKRAKDHIDQFTRLSKKDAKALEEKIKALDLELTSERVAKIVDLLPETIDDVRAIFAKERFKYTEDEIKKITDLISQYA